MSDFDATMGASPAAVPGMGDSMAAAHAQLKKVKKQKVLLMGKSGSGKSSMRSIIFSNYLARDTRRLGATIDIDLSHVKFLGNLTLNLWDCGGQEAFMENYLSQQRAHVFSNVGVLIYVFDIESRDVERDLATYVNIISALVQYSREAKVFVLIHKMDLIQPLTREDVFEHRASLVRRKTTEAVAIVHKQKPPSSQTPQPQSPITSPTTSSPPPLSISNSSRPPFGTNRSTKPGRQSSTTSSPTSPSSKRNSPPWASPLTRTKSSSSNAPPSLSSRNGLRPRASATHMATALSA